MVPTEVIEADDVCSGTNVTVEINYVPLKTVKSLEGNTPLLYLEIHDVVYLGKV